MARTKFILNGHDVQQVKGSLLSSLLDIEGECTVIAGEISLPELNLLSLRGNVIAKVREQDSCPVSASLVIGTGEYGIQGFLEGDPIVSYDTLPLRDDSVESVIINGVIDYSILKEVHRVLRRGGSVVFSCPGYSAPQYLDSALRQLVQFFRIQRSRFQGGSWFMEMRKP